MACTVIGPAAQAEALGLPTGRLAAPADFEDAMRYAARLMVVGPRYLGDRDIDLLNRVPAALVLNKPVDIVHLEMHIRAGRLTLTPYDAIYWRGDLAPFQHAAPWIAPVLGDGPPASFLEADPDRPLRRVPDGFEALPKQMFVKLGEAMRRLHLTQFDLVLGLTETCRGLAGCVCNPVSVLYTEAEALPPDVICAEPAEIETVLAAYPDCRILICPAVLDSKTPIELVHRNVAAAAPAPVHLAQTQMIAPLPGGGAACLTFEIG